MSTQYQDPRAPFSEQTKYQQLPPGYQPGFQPPYRPDPLPEQLEPSSLGIRPNVAAAVSYLWIIGLIFFFTERNSRFVRFHALQGMLWGVTNWLISSVFWYASPLHSLGGLFSLIWLIVGVVTALLAYRGRWKMIPVIGDIAYKNAMSWNPPDNSPPGNMPYPPR
jgi:uncharacterized membrane protein